MDQETRGASPLLGIVVTRVGDEVAIGLSGELDVSSAPRLRDELQVLIDSGAFKFTLDIASLRYVDSSGLSVILMAHKRLEDVGGILILLSPAPSVLRLFEITGVAELLVIDPPEAAKATE